VKRFFTLGAIEPEDLRHDKGTQGSRG
jgi:hypothetical protein